MLLIKTIACAAIVLGAALVFYLDAKYRAYKTRKQQEFAETIGMTYHDVTPDGMYSRYCGFDLVFNRRRVGMGNVFSAETEDLQILIFELGYETGKKFSQNHGKAISQTVVAIEAKDQDFPYFSNFKLESNNIKPEQCRDFFAPELVEFVSQRRDLVVQGFEKRLLMYKPGKQVPQTDYRRLVEQGFEVFHVLNKLSTPKETVSTKKPVLSS